jgi:hypothetical protein
MFARGVAVWGAEKHFFNLKSASRGHFRSIPESSQNGMSRMRWWRLWLLLWPVLQLRMTRGSGHLS